MVFNEWLSITRAKFQAPLPKGLIRNGHTSFRQQLFALLEAETESMVEPKRVTDNIEEKAMPLVAVYVLFHAAQSAKPKLNSPYHLAY